MVSNGIVFCKIHHVAFDKNIIGVRPDLVVEVQPRILDEIDGPMLLDGMQEMEGQRLVSRDADTLSLIVKVSPERYEQFRMAS